MATKRKIDREAQDVQFKILADSIEAQRASTKDADVHYNRRKATVYVLVRHVSRSGMRRVIDFKAPVVWHNGEPGIPTFTLVGADTYRYDYDRNGYVVDGCGMDMGFLLTDSIMRQLRKWCEANGREDLATELRDWQSIVRHQFL